MNKVYITDYIEYPNIEIELLGDELSNEINDSIEIILVWHEKINKSFIDKLPNLKGIIRYGVGYDNIDLNYAASKNIIVCNTPDYGIDEVSDTAIAMILNISRGVSQYDFLSKYQNNWQENTLKKLKRSSEYKLGIIGAGRIGGSVLLKAKSLGFQTLFFDPYTSKGHDKMLNAKQVDKIDELLEISDIISIHTPLTNETKGMVNKEFIAKMKTSSSLVNTARGKIINDIDDFYTPIRTNKIYSLALDVLPDEPPKESKLISSWRKGEEWIGTRLLINPHTAYYSKQSFVEMRTKASKNALRIINKELPHNIIK
jgi:D-3-phosphoglycerate dehydrogenase